MNDLSYFQRRLLLLASFNLHLHWPVYWEFVSIIRSASPDLLNQVLRDYYVYSLLVGFMAFGA